MQKGKEQKKQEIKNKNSEISTRSMEEGNLERIIRVIKGEILLPKKQPQRDF